MLSAYIPEAQAQQAPELRIEQTRGNIGSIVGVPLRLLGQEASAWQGVLTLEGQMTLSNSSLVYPRAWQPPSASVQFLHSNLSRLNDSVYTFALTLRRMLSSSSQSANDTIAYLRAELLAGSDTAMTIFFHNLRFTDAAGTRSIASTSGIITVDFVDVGVPFVRLAQMQPNAPNPVQRGSETRWAYTIDAPSEVVFTIYNLSGEEVEKIVRTQTRGFHIETWVPRANLAAGAYFVRFSSNSGDVLQRLLIE